MTGSPRPDNSRSRELMARAPEPKTAPSGSVGDGNLAEPMKIRDFFEGVATIYDLPAREVAAAPVAPAAPVLSTEAKARRRVAERRLAAVLALAVLLALVVGIARQEPVSILPSNLYGGWSTNHSGYQDRGFWLTATSLTIRTGPDPDEATVHPIRRVLQLPSRGDTIDFAVDYEAEGGMVTWKFQYVHSASPTIRFLNQKDLVWTPVP